MKWIQTPPRNFNPPQLLPETLTVARSTLVELHRSITTIRYTCRTTHGNRVIMFAECDTGLRDTIHQMMRHDYAMSQLQNSFKRDVNKSRPRYRFAISRVKRR